LIKKLKEIVDRPKRNYIYDVLCHLNLGLCVDVGAAAGLVTKKLCSVGGPHTRVVAFEPFPGNHQYFHQSIKDLNNKISLIEKAVSDDVGMASFVVPSVVQGTETDWGKYVGYSSVGFLSNAPGVVSKAEQYLKVKTTTIDIEFPNEEIDFMKVDVQGGEAKVLRGAGTMLQENRIHVLYIEWSGEAEIVEILANYGYEIYDSNYVVGPKVHDPQPFQEIGFQIIGEGHLSTGEISYEMILVDDSVSPACAISEVRKRGLGWIQTDLIVISPNIKEQFLKATKRLSEEQAKKTINTDS
jgi:FkbM family methyltransferase